MLSKGPAKKVTIYLNEDARHHLGSLYESIMTFLLHKGVAGATATRALEGFGSHRILHTPKSEVLAEHLPVRIEFIDTAQKVDELLPALYDMLTDGLIEVQDTIVVKVARKEKPAAAVPHTRVESTAKVLRVFLGESDDWKDIVNRLRVLGVAGATVYRGIDGYGAKGHSHKESFLHLSKDLPIMITAVDDAEKIAEAAAAVEQMLGDGLIVVADAQMTRFVRSLPSEEPPHAAG